MDICQHFGFCGGCTYLDMPCNEEIAMKEASLGEMFAPFLGGATVSVLPAPRQEGYRNKMELAFGDEGRDGKMALGMRKKRSFYEVATPLDCVLICDDFKKIIACVLEYFRETGEAVFHRKRHTGALRHLVLRRGEFTGEILLNLSHASCLEAPLAPLVQRLLALPLDGQIVGILHAINDGVADAVKNENIGILHGRDYYNEEICGLKFRVSAFSFFQTNSAGAEKLYSLVCEYAGQGRLAYDLYCGTGTIAQVLSPNFEKIIGIEIVADAITAAKENVRLNNIENCYFHAGDAIELLSSPPEMPDVAVVDPPRDGLHQKALTKLIELSPPKIVYVACKPASLARDLTALTEAGYVLEKLQGMDMFPRTVHVEAIALLRRN